MSLPLKQDAPAEIMPTAALIMLAALVLILFASLAHAWYRKRKGAVRLHFDWRRWLSKPAGSCELTVLTTTRLTLRTNLHVIEWDGRHLLLASSDQGVSVLAEKGGAIVSATHSTTEPASTGAGVKVSG